MGLFQKGIDPMCTYCTHGHPLGTDQILCPKRGVMESTSRCPSFRYDPLKRVPPRPAKLAGRTLTDDDFAL